MRQLFEHMQTFQRRNGRYPNSQSQPSLFVDMAQNYRDYGFASMEEAGRWFRNPDMRQADIAAGAANWEAYDPFHLPGVRHDGTPTGSAKPAGTRDVLAWTDMYFHRNIRVQQGDRTTTAPEGFYLVLWDDGQVSRVPYSEVRFVDPQQSGPWPEYFPGQAGVAQSATKSYAEYEADRRRLAHR